MKNRTINILSLLVIIFSLSNCISNQSKNELTRQDAVPASLTPLTELREAVGWYRDSLGKWKSSNKSITGYSIPHREDNFTYIAVYDANYNGKNYIVLDIGYLNFVSSNQRRFTFAGGHLFSWDERTSDTDEWNTYYIIDPRRFRISLRENRAVNNSIEHITYSPSNLNEDLQRSVTSHLRSERKFKGRIHFYTLYNREESIVRFYIDHRNSTGIFGSTVFEDYYYEVDYQKFMEVFGNWVR